MNFQNAVIDPQDLNRLNFSRDMLAGTGKNFIFFTTPYGDDRLAKGAYDFYSFIKMRMVFHGYGTSYGYETEKDKTEKDKTEEAGQPFDDASAESEWTKESAKEFTKEWTQELTQELTQSEAGEKLKETYLLLEQAKNERVRAHYEESVMLLLKAKSIREKLLGIEHLDMAEIYRKLADVYNIQGRYKKAEKLYQKALELTIRAWGGKNIRIPRKYMTVWLIYIIKKKK